MRLPTNIGDKVPNTHRPFFNQTSYSPVQFDYIQMRLSKDHQPKYRQVPVFVVLLGG